MASGKLVNTMRFMHSMPWVLLIVAVTSVSCTVPTTLDLKLMKQVTTDLSKNEAISPIIMSILMSQVWLATNSATRNEITPVLGAAQSTFLPAYQSAINYIAAGSSQLTVNVFNRMYVRSTFSVRPSFTNYLTMYYGASVKSFSNNVQAANEINSDVASVTNNRIQNLVKSDLLLNAQVVLVSAMYFKGDWKHTFHPAIPASFLTQNGEKQVHMMKLNVTQLQYADMGTYDAVALPYTDGDYCMLLMRPAQRSMTAVTALRNTLDTLSIDSIIQQLSLQPVAVSIPRFKVEADYKLKAPITQLGIQKIFSLGGDFSGLTVNHAGLFVSEIVHKVFIEVNEQGTEAAGAGAVIVTRRSPIPKFIADRPFFAVVYNKHKINMFTVYVGSPTQA